MSVEVPEPDWKRLGARFGVPDVCVRFAGKAEVYVHEDAGARLVAENAVALREDYHGVRVQVACGLILELPGLRIEHSDAADGSALLVRPVRVPVRPRPRRSWRDEWFRA